MRKYGTKTIPATNRQKNDVGTKYGKPIRPLTAEDFETIPEHQEERLLEICCEICGTPGEFYDDDITNGEPFSSLVNIQFFRGTGVESYDDCTKEFLEDDWYEVCSSCMRNTIAPYLKSLRNIHTQSDTSPQPEEEPAVVSAMEDSWRFNGRPQEKLIGREDEILSTALPPISADEPF